MSVVACPPGWTQINWGGYFLRVTNNAPNTTGGADTHQHDGSGFFVPDHVHGAGTYAAANHNHNGSVGFNGNTDPGGTHRHGFGVHVTSGNSQGGNFIAPVGSAQGASNHPHQHQVNFDGETADNGSHSHTISATAAIVGDAPPVTGQSGGSGAFAGITGLTGVAANVPVHVNVFICQKN
jgi:hypothetical protein